MKNILFPDAIDDYTRIFVEACTQHALIFQRCHDCGHVRWPLSFVCPGCASQKAEWIKSEGKGRVYSYAVFHVPFHHKFIDKIPYIVAVIELREGPHFLTNIIGCDPAQVKCDMEVKIAWEDISPEINLPKFRPLTLP